MSSKSLSHRGVVHLGLDVSKDSIAVGVLRPEDRVADVEKIAHDEESVRRLVTRLGAPSRLWACYEAGPTGYELHRLLERLGVRCDVIAPSLIPRAPGDKIKTDRRDAKRLARLHRAGDPHENDGASGCGPGRPRARRVGIDPYPDGNLGGSSHGPASGRSTARPAVRSTHRSRGSTSHSRQRRTSNSSRSTPCPECLQGRLLD